VLISHSIHFYNRLTEAYGDASQRVTEEEMAALLSRGVTRPHGTEQISNRAVLFKRSALYGSLTLFQGGREMLPARALKGMPQGSARVTNDASAKVISL